MVAESWWIRFTRADQDPEKGALAWGPCTTSHDAGTDPRLLCRWRLQRRACGFSRPPPRSFPLGAVGRDIVNPSLSPIPRRRDARYRKMCSRISTSLLVGMVVVHIIQYRVPAGEPRHEKTTKNREEILKQMQPERLYQFPSLIHTRPQLSPKAHSTVALSLYQKTLMLKRKHSVSPLTITPLLILRLPHPRINSQPKRREGSAPARRGPGAPRSSPAPRPSCSPPRPRSRGRSLRGTPRRRTRFRRRARRPCRSLRAVDQEREPMSRKPIFICWRRGRDVMGVWGAAGGVEGGVVGHLVSLG